MNTSVKIEYVKRPSSLRKYRRVKIVFVIILRLNFGQIQQVR